ncbi:MAG TPA: 2'-5' RNA ligase family protein [Dokdonella sp.]|uniref:2'-5' RNA ligase family protein n=1 Tax=Dokdonella sp. TaxID=2291710 RepID=UPI002D039DA8|nr:2'-5' RNA ligase family protein [Dokdonella sp.]HUD42357.1 2'-5' RNA ligase family protein [Dokdonella sp.]
MHVDLFPTGPLHRLFFALRPDAPTAAAIERVAAPLRVVHPRARWVAPARYHATLLYLGENAGERPDWASRAHEAAVGLTTAAFTLRFDRLAALGTPSRPALALAADVPDALRVLHETLRRRCLERGFRLGQAGSALLPHVTIAYTDPKPALPTIDPVQWHPHHFELVQSVQGRAGHDVLGRWPLLPGA